MGKVEHPFEHLTDAQIEHYGDRTSGEGPNQSSLEVDQAIETHLADCAGCRTRVLEFHRARLGLMSNPVPSAANPSDPGTAGYQNSGSQYQTRSSSSATERALAEVIGRDERRPTPDCPTEDTLRDLAAGLSTSADASRLTQHAAQCLHCGPILRAYTEDFSDDLSPEDAALLQQLNSSSPSWQKKVAQQMAGAVSPATTPNASSSAASEHTASDSAVAQAPAASEKAPVAQPPSAVQIQRKPWLRLPSLKWILAPTALAATAVIALFIWNAQRDTPEKVAKLLVQAYTEQRTMEIRLPGAAWGPINTTRGSESLSKPLPLLEAANSIQQQSPEALTRTDWLHARAQSEILSGEPSQQLLEELNAALQRQPDAIPLMFDVAAANFKIGERTSNRDRYLQSKLALDEILKRSPSNSIALFNRAIVEERLAMRNEAINDLTASIASEHDPEWAEEARARRQQLKEQLQFTDE